MTLKTALRHAVCCGLNTYGEAVWNIHIHASTFFPYDSMMHELEELTNEVVVLKDLYGKEWQGVRIPQELVDEENQKLENFMSHVKN